MSQKAVLDAIEAFGGCPDKDALWQAAHRHMAPYGITGLLYGCETAGACDDEHLFIMNSCDPRWLDAKMDSGLFYCDAYVEVSRKESAPALWNDVNRLSKCSPLQLQSLALDFEFGVTTGFTLPMRFADFLGASGIGCHAGHLSWAEFDKIWAEHNAALIGMAEAFDVALRRDHKDALFPLTAAERECLSWLACGLRPDRIADRMFCTVKVVQNVIASAKAKLKATTTAQAVAVAVIFGLVAP